MVAWQATVPVKRRSKSLSIKWIEIEWWMNWILIQTHILCRVSLLLLLSESSYDWLCWSTVAALHGQAPSYLSECRLAANIEFRLPLRSASSPRRRRLSCQQWSQRPFTSTLSPWPPHMPGTACQWPSIHYCTTSAPSLHVFRTLLKTELVTDFLPPSN